MSSRQDEVPKLTLPSEAARRPVIYDVTRIVTRALNAAPNGIDRVDFALARHFLARNARAREALICTAIGPRLADPDLALETIEGVVSLWREDGDAEEDYVYRRVVEALGSKDSTVSSLARARKRPDLLFLERNWRAMRRWAPHLGRPLREAPQGAVYFNVTQFLVDRSWYVRWLTARTDVKPVFFVHDLLPIEAPEFFRAREDRMRSPGAFANMRRKREGRSCRYASPACRFRRSSCRPPSRPRRSTASIISSSAARSNREKIISPCSTHGACWRAILRRQNWSSSASAAGSTAPSSKRWSGASPCARMSSRRADCRRRDCADCLLARALC